MAKQKKRPNIVSISMTPQAKAKLNKVCADRGMTIQSLLGRLLEGFFALDQTEQSIVLGQVEAKHVRTLADLIGRRGPK